MGAARASAFAYACGQVVILLAVALVTLASTELAVAGHGAAIPERVNRYVGTVVAVAEPDADGNIYAFETDIPDLALNQIRSWRITFFTGELYAYVFQVRENRDSTVAVTSLDGPLNGIAIGDMFLVEQMNVTRPTPQMREGGP